MSRNEVVLVDIDGTVAHRCDRGIYEFSSLRYVQLRAVGQPSEKLVYKRVVRYEYLM